MRPSRRRIGAAHAAAAERARLDLETERLLETTQGRRLLDACDGDVEHARRIIDVVGHVPPLAAGHSSDNVIRLPRLEPYDWLEPDAIERPAAFQWSTLLLACGIGLAAWLLVAAVAFGLYVVVEAIR